MADKQQAEQTADATVAVISYLKEITEENKIKMIRSLNQKEAEGIAAVAIGAYVQTRQRQEDEEALDQMLDDGLNDRIDDLIFA